MTPGLAERHPLKEKRRANKPLLERKRRARINDSLADLKALVLSSLNKDVSKYTKMEKVDILDMTVQFLKGNCFEKPIEDHLSIYRAGYTECTQEIYRSIMTMDGLDYSHKYKILSKIAERFNPEDRHTTPPPSPKTYGPKPAFPVLPRPCVPPTHFNRTPQTGQLTPPIGQLTPPIGQITPPIGQLAPFLPSDINRISKKEHCTPFKSSRYDVANEQRESRYDVTNEQRESRYDVANEQRESRYDVPNEQRESRYDVANEQRESRYDVPNEQRESRYEVANEQRESRYDVANKQLESRYDVTNEQCESRYEVTNEQRESRYEVALEQCESTASRNSTSLYSKRADVHTDKKAITDKSPSVVWRPW